jgi:hypothetical protein
MAGNYANYANYANAGNAGGGSVGGAADRVDLPFVAATDGAGVRLSDAVHRFGHEGSFAPDWTAPFAAWRILSEFTDTAAWRRRQRAADGAPGQGGLALADWRSVVRDMANAGPAAPIAMLVDAEIDTLVTLAETERADALGEIVDQSDAFGDAFLTLLAGTTPAYRATAGLITAAIMVAGLAAQHFKQLSQRRRPSQVCPALRPPIPVPGHAAYPSGHATQAFLVAACLETALTGTRAAGAIPAAHALAKRIARNREIAGVHYASDTEGGRRLAGAVLPALAAGKSFRALRQKATAEWS